MVCVTSYTYSNSDIDEAINTYNQSHNNDVKYNSDKFIYNVMNNPDYAHDIRYDYSDLYHDIKDGGGAKEGAQVHF